MAASAPAPAHGDQTQRQRLRNKSQHGRPTQHRRRYEVPYTFWQVVCAAVQFNAARDWKQLPDLHRNFKTCPSTRRHTRRILGIPGSARGGAFTAGVARLVCLSRHDLQLFQRRGARHDRGRDRVRGGEGDSLHERAHRVAIAGFWKMRSKKQVHPIGMRTRTRTRISSMFCLYKDELFLDPKSHFPKSSIAGFQAAPFFKPCLTDCCSLNVLSPPR